VRPSIRRIAIIVSLLVSLSAVAPGMGAAGTLPTLTSSQVQAGLTYPWDLAFTPDGKMLVTLRGGQVRVYANGNASAALLNTTTIAGVRAEGEAGLMGIAVDPQFATNRYVYLCASRTDNGWRNQVLRYQLQANNTLTFDRYVIRNGMAANRIHNGCALEFIGLKLWVTMGDAGNSGLAQNRNSLNGKILRANTDGSVPADNPVIGGTRNLVYSMGHRNPQGIAVLPGAGRIYAVEHGPERDDEINWIRPGRNYGWPCRTGNNRAYQTSGCSPYGYTAAAWWSGNSTIATSGATFITGEHWGSMSGQLWISQLKERDVRRFREVSPGDINNSAIYYNNVFGRIRGAVRGPYGRLYVTTSNGGGADRIIWIAPKG
jgi:glucose/arabinose dehydrogenase